MRHLSLRRNVPVGNVQGIFRSIAIKAKRFAGEAERPNDWGERGLRLSPYVLIFDP